MPSKTFINKVTEINGATQEIIEREATLEEIAAQEALAQESIMANAVKETLKEQKTALLERLGITAEEAELLLA